MAKSFGADEDSKQKAVVEVQQIFGRRAPAVSAIDYSATISPMPYPRHPPTELEVLLAPRRRLPARLQGLLYLLTGLTTFAAGAVGWDPLLLGVDNASIAAAVTTHWDRGLLYMVAVMGVLTAHEAGHFIAARLHGIPATLPFFIPMPVLLTGTLGAVIGMEGSRANRRELFDIAVAGPLAGLVVAVPLLAMGLLVGSSGQSNPFALAPLAVWIQSLVRPDLAPGTTVAPNALFMAGWVGLLVTGLNMIPVSQLDGGHICYAVFGRKGNWVARAVLIGSILAVVISGQNNWVALLVIVTFLGVDHPPIREEQEPIGVFRTALGLAMFVIPVLTFMPEPLLLR
jgi:membrane-associated protease RseP (regulator of RpoE activity)